MARPHKLTKVESGDYLLRFAGDDAIYRVTKEAALGSGAQGMYEIVVWMLWRWPEPTGEAPVTAPDQIGRWQRLGEAGTRRDAVGLAERTATHHTAGEQGGAE